jgi:hypothetical protein
MLCVSLLMLLEAVDQEFHRWLETIEGSLMSLGLKSYLFKRQEEVMNMFKQCSVVVCKHNQF